MSSNMVKCKPINDREAICRLDGKEVKCKTRKDEVMYHCSKSSTGEWNDCNPVDFYCNISQDSKDVKLVPESTSFQGEKMVYYFSYGITNFNELRHQYNKCAAKNNKPEMTDAAYSMIKSRSKAGILKGYRLGFFGKSSWGKLSDSGSTATITKNSSSDPASDVKGIIMLVPEEVMECFNTRQQVNTGKYLRTTVNARVVEGPTESELGEVINCWTYIGNEKLVSGNKKINDRNIVVADTYLAMMVLMLVDRQYLMTNGRLDLVKRNKRTNQSGELELIFKFKIRPNDSAKVVEEKTFIYNLSSMNVYHEITKSLYV